MQESSKVAGMSIRPNNDSRLRQPCVGVGGVGGGVGVGVGVGVGHTFPVIIYHTLGRLLMEPIHY